MLKARRALISVFDKSDLEEFARGLVRLGIDIVSTGGTFRALERAGISVQPVAEVTHFPEILDGRVKTLHPNVHGGILANRARASHAAELREHGIQPIDIVVVNLYPFRETARREDASFEEVVEMIDIGGPTMVRAAAKNHRGVLVVVDPADYPQVLAALEEGAGEVPDTLLRRLAIKAFRHTEAYDAAIAEWLELQSGDADEPFRRHFLVDAEKVQQLRYGENPHQTAAAYRLLGRTGLLGGFEKLQGKELSFNNFLDADAARRIVSRFEAPAVAIVKHSNPCGVGVARSSEDIAIAFERARECDPEAAFGSIIALNRAATDEFAAAIGKMFVEVILSPEFDDGALKRLSTKSNLRLLTCPMYRPLSGASDVRWIDGGFLAQIRDDEIDDPTEWICATKREPTSEEREGMEFAWLVCRDVKSNAIVVANHLQTVGIGAGQMSRVDACRFAVAKTRLPLAGCVAASDAFFPFRDGLDVLAEAGVRAIVQPGGSKRDAEVIAAADEHEVAMLMTARRHFRH